MRKPQLIRQLIESTHPEIKQNPDRLFLNIENCQVISSLGNSTSHEYRYTLNIIIEQFSADISTLTVPLLEFLRENQPELLHNPERRDDAFSIDIDYNNHTTADVLIQLKLTERVVVKQVNGRYQIDYLNEPSLNKFLGIV